MVLVWDGFNLACTIVYLGLLRLAILMREVGLIAQYRYDDVWSQDIGTRGSRMSQRLRARSNCFESRRFNDGMVRRCFQYASVRH